MIEGTLRNPFDKTPSAVVYKPMAIYYGCEMDFWQKQRLHEIAVSKGNKEFEMYIDRMFMFNIGRWIIHCQ